MKLELDTIKKTITLIDNVNIGELYDMFASMGIDVDEWTVCTPSQISLPYYPKNDQVWSPIYNPLAHSGTTNPYTINCNTSEGQTLTGNITGNTTNTNVKAENVTPTVFYIFEK